MGLLTELRKKFVCVIALSTSWDRGESEIELLLLEITCVAGERLLLIVMSVFCSANKGKVCP